MSKDIPDQPHSEETERALLATILSAPTHAGSAYGTLEAAHFYRERHRYLWRAIEQCIEDGAEPDLVSVAAALESGGWAEKVPDGYLERLEAPVPQPAKLEDYADQILELARRRKLQQTCQTVASRISERDLDYEQAREVLDQVCRETTRADATSRLDEAVQKVVDEAEQIEQGDETPYFETGIAPVDGLIDGFYPSRLYVLAGRPKMGKTSLACAMLWGLAERHGFAVDVWYSDGSTKHVADAILTHVSGVPSEPRKTGRLTEHQWREITKAQGAIADAPVFLHQRGAPTPSEIRMRARSMAAQHERYMVVVDYLQNCDAGHTGGDRERLNTVAATKCLDNVAADLNCVALGLAQFNRSAEGERVPKYYQLKSSGEIEESVNDLLVWHRPEWSKQDAGPIEERFGLLNHQLSKHAKSGGGAMAHIDADLARNRFRKYSKERILSEEATHARRGAV